MKTPSHTCHYTRDEELDQYTPACDPELCVHPYDSYDWRFCPFCGGLITPPIMENPS
ncbi:hypothetical protein THIOSC15_2100010 [uncultured Thiomicrorhabdus sp.]